MLKVLLIMIKKILLLSFVTFGSINILCGQDTWTLEKCIEYAQKNNITIKQSQIQVNNADLNVRQSKAARYPNAGFSTNFGYNFGYAINPSTNQFANLAIGFNSLSANINETVYDGGRINKSIKQAKINRDATQADLDQSVQNISLNVASAYLQILLAEEQLASAKKRFEQSKQQLEQIEKLIIAGSRPANDKMDFVAQAARNEQSIVAAQNTVDISYLNLKQLLELDPELIFRIERPIVNIPINEVEALTMRAVYNQAYSRQPQIKAGELRLRSAELDADIAKSDLRPTLSVFGNLTSNYSTASAKTKLTRGASPVGFELRTVPYVTHINGNPIVAQALSPVYSPDQIQKYTYFQHLKDNFGQALGVSLQIPIYDRGITRIAVERAKLGVISQQLTNQRTQQQLKSDIQTALANAKAAKKQLEAAEKTYNAAKGAYDNADKKYKVGAATPFELTTARNSMDTAERDFIVAKYDYIFKLKIVDFYQGKKIVLN